MSDIRIVCHYRSDVLRIVRWLTLRSHYFAAAPQDGSRWVVVIPERVNMNELKARFKFDVEDESQQEQTHEQANLQSVPAGTQ